VGLWLAANAPVRVSRAVFANTAARIGTAESWTARMELVSAGGMGAIGEMVLARFLSERFRLQYPEEAIQIRDMLEATHPQGYIGACAALRDADLRAALPAIHAQSLIIVGEEDEATPPAQAQELHNAMSRSELVMLREAAHLSNVEQPEAFSSAVLAFLSHA
jgi:3-oxoadipate enol-lactonase